MNIMLRHSCNQENLFVFAFSQHWWPDGIIHWSERSNHYGIHRNHIPTAVFYFKTTEF